MAALLGGLKSKVAAAVPAGVPAIPAGLPAVPGAGALQGLAGKVPGLPALPGLPGLPGIPGMPNVGSIATQGQEKLRQFMFDGFAIGKLALFFLAGGIPVAPFSFWGYGAVNLMAAGSKGWAALKALTQLAFVFINKVIGAYFPKLWWLGWLLVLNPWYVFDIVQLFSPTFETEGFKVPFYGESILPADGIYRLNGVIIGIMIVLLSLGGISLLTYLPPEIIGSAKPAIELAFKIVGGIVAVGGGGLGAYMFLPQLMSAMRSSPAAAAMQGGAAEGAEPQKGGGGQGSAYPSLQEIAAGLLGPNPKADPVPFRSTIITGGGSGAKKKEVSTAESAIFLGTLGLAALAGLSLAVARSKGTSGA